MKNIRQSRILKAAAVILLFFSMVVVPLSIIGEAYLSREVFNGRTQEMFGGEFTESVTFSSLFNKRLGQLAEYVELKNILETDGELDYERTVCYMPETGTAYTVGDLIKRSGFFVENIDSQEEVLLNELFSTAYYPWEQSYGFLNEEGIPEIGYLYDSEFIRDFSKETDWILVEEQEEALDRYRLYSGYAEEDLRANAEMDGAVSYAVEASLFAASADTVEIQNMTADTELPQGSMLISTLDDLAYRYTYYAAYYLYYDKLFSENTGQRFLYEVSNGTDTYKNAENLEAYCLGDVQADGSLYYSSSGYVMNTDVADVNRSFVDNLENALSADGSEVTVFAAVADWTPDISADDTFGVAEERFLTAQSVGGALLVIGIAGGFGILVLGFYLLASAGHAKGTEGVRLTAFDKWYTELAALVSLLLLGMTAGLDISLLADASNGYYSVASLIAAGCLLIASYLLGMFSAASLVRRIKAGILWKNSLLRNGGRWIAGMCRRLVRGCRIVYEERDITSRSIIVYVIVLAVTVITGSLIMLSLWEGSILVLFFLLLFAGIHAGTLYMILRERIEYKRIMEGVERMADGDLNYKIDEAGMQMDNKRLAVAANRVGDGLSEAIRKSIKDERMKTDLITNVSHDIKTPLTSIINYVDLLKREKIEDEKIRSYIDVLDSKSQRLKNLTDDLVEASKLSSGNVILTMQEINLVELVNQANGEFMEKFALKNLSIIPMLPENPVIIEADGRRLWRVLENLYNNVAKYAMQNTRVYVSVVQDNDRVSFVMKNISENPLNINADELTERFIRGDVSRSTEGSGLGLSIARSLTELMKGNFEIYLDGDLFRVTVTFPVNLLAI